MPEPTAADIRKVLSSHGHAFQYAVLRRAEELAQEQRSDWIFEAAEFPVGEASNTIHIDFVLANIRRSVYLVAECKRADPARAHWCFIKAPYTRRDPSDPEQVFEEVQYGPANIHWVRPRTKHAAPGSFHLGFELRSSEKGEGVASGPAIKDATTQVMRGLNGLINQLHGGSPSVSERGSCIFVPAIFTTAKLWVARGDISDADLASGQLPADWGELTAVPWLWYSHNQSPDLRHQVQAEGGASSSDLSQVLRAEYTRTIAIVGPDGIDAFLQAGIAAWA
jgi:hypothetical protein